MQLIPDVDRLLAALSLVALLLYITPMVRMFDISEAGRKRLQWAAIATLGAGFAMALIASAAWYAK
jgi:hypothetical protein